MSKGNIFVFGCPWTFVVLQLFSLFRGFIGYLSFISFWNARNLNAYANIIMIIYAASNIKINAKKYMSWNGVSYNISTIAIAGHTGNSVPWSKQAIAWVSSGMETPTILMFAFSSNVVKGNKMLNGEKWKEKSLRQNTSIMCSKISTYTNYTPAHNCWRHLLIHLQFALHIIVYFS